MWALKLLLVPIFFYVAFLAILFFAQTSLIFPARLAGGTIALPAEAERLSLQAADGTRLAGVRLPARTGGRSAPIILAFPGNASNAESVALLVRDIAPDAEVIAFHYRGYAPSGGTTSASALLADSEQVHDFVRSGSAGRPIIVVGLSIGSGIAAHLAAVRPLSGAVLVTPFDSLAAVASDHYCWVPVRLLLRHNLEPAEELSKSDVPIALIVAGQDSLIPPAHADALALHIRRLIGKTIIRGVGHNDIYVSPLFAPTLRKALEAVLDVSKAAKEK